MNALDAGFKQIYSTLTMIDTIKTQRAYLMNQQEKKDIKDIEFILQQSLAVLMAKGYATSQDKSSLPEALQKELEAIMQEEHIVSANVNTIVLQASELCSEVSQAIKALLTREAA